MAKYLEEAGPYVTRHTTTNTENKDKEEKGEKVTNYRDRHLTFYSLFKGIIP